MLHLLWVILCWWVLIGFAICAGMWVMLGILVLPAKVIDELPDYLALGFRYVRNKVKRASTRRWEARIAAVDEHKRELGRQVYELDAEAERLRKELRVIDSSLTCLMYAPPEKEPLHINRITRAVYAALNPEEAGRAFEDRNNEPERVTTPGLWSPKAS